MIPLLVPMDPIVGFGNLGEQLAIVFVGFIVAFIFFGILKVLVKNTGTVGVVGALLLAGVVFYVVKGGGLQDISDMFKALVQKYAK